MSSRITYEQAYADRQYLWRTYGPASDMNGGYVEGKKFEALLKNPTKAQARRECIRQIEYWFEVGTEAEPMCSEFVPGPVTCHADPRVAEIARRHWIAGFAEPEARPSIQREEVLAEEQP